MVRRMGIAFYDFDRQQRSSDICSGTSERHARGDETCLWTFSRGRYRGDISIAEVYLDHLGGLAHFDDGNGMKPLPPFIC